MPIINAKAGWGEKIPHETLQKEVAKLTLGSNVRYLRKYRGLSQQELADKISAPQRSVSEIESGDSNLTFDKMERLAEALGVSISTLTSDHINWKMVEAVDYLMSQIGGVIDTLKAMKLMYFTDLLHRDENGTKLTSVTYYRYNFGPFSRDIYAIQSIFERVDDNTVKHSAPFGSYSFLTQEDLGFLKGIAKKYGHLSGTALMKLSYETAPMKALGATL